MAHLRYIKKDGKVYGPYSYRSVRTKDGKIKNIYLGKPQKNITKGVVQKIVFTSIIILLFFIILFFLKSPETPTGLVVLENELSEEIGNYEIKQTEQGYDIKIRDDTKDELNSEISIKGIKNISTQITTKIGLPKEGKWIKTDVFAVKEELNFDNAILNLRKTGNVDYILHCQNFDFEKFKCEDWEETDITFIDLGEYIQFEVPHFTAYAGGGTGTTDSNLTIWDDTDTEGGSNKRYVSGCQLPIGCSSKTDFYFFANYTNHTEQSINISSSNCSIDFNLNLTADEAWTGHVNMSFVHSREQYEYNRSFNNRGTFEFNVSCWDTDAGPDSFEDNSTVDTFVITNSKPYVVDEDTFLATPLYCNEDEWCYLNFSDNCTDPDQNDADSLIYEINETNAYMWFDTSTGNLSVYATSEDEVFTGSFRLTVSDTATPVPGSYSTDLQIIVSAVNDAPTSTLNNQSIDEDTSWQINLSEYYSDEESNVLYFRENNTEEGDPQFINISYSPTPPYALNGEIINVTPSNNEVGNYSLNITVNDTSGNELSMVVIFEVNNTNDPPSLDWVCVDNDTNFTLTEDELFTCAVNATDDDMNETWGSENLTFAGNETWFEFLWQSNNESNVTFTPSDEQVGFWWINITVTDLIGVIDSKLINITILNISDAPFLNTIANFTAYANMPYTFSINATDEDLNISGGGEALNFSINYTIAELSSEEGIVFEFGDAYIDENNLTLTYSNITFTPSSAKEVFWINFSVNDTDGFTKSQLVNITIRGNTRPTLDATINNNATEDIEFYINLTWNVTDPDGDDIIWSDNTTLFDINATTGEINFTANDSYVGENWVNITVIDDPPGAQNSSVLNFTVYNVEDTPNFTEPIGNHTATEDSEFYLVINATDEDFYIPEGNVFDISENLTFAVNDTSLFDIVKENETNATINFTAVNNSQAGLYWFEINVTDRTGLCYNETINITIIAVNDAPQFVDFDNLTANQNVLVEYDFNASDEENGTDTFDGVDSNLTFWIENITNATDGDLIGGTTITRTFFDNSIEALNGTTGVLSFTPTATHAGTGTGSFDYKINISVNDSNGAIASEIINLSIRNENDAPTVNCVLLTASGFGSAEAITMYENDTNMTFSISSVEDLDGDVLTFQWWLDDVLNESESKGPDTGKTTEYSDTWSYLPGFLDAHDGRNLTLLITDGINISTASNSDYGHSCFRNITVLETNSPPTFILTIQNITWNQDTTYTNLDLDDHFSDIENQTTLNFTYDRFDEDLVALAEADSQITVEINDAHGVTFTPASGWSGMEYIRFNASDLIDSVISNTVLLNVSAVAAAPVYIAVPSPAGGAGVKKKLITIDIIHPGSLTLYKEDLLVSPIIIRNTNEAITLRNIDITAESLYGLELSLSETHIDQLSPGEEKEIQLSVRGTTPGFEEITVKAIVHDPEVTDSAKIFATIISIPKEIEERIRFVKDLFKENPECLELNELIIAAEKDLAAHRDEAALKKINTAIDKCKDLISIIYKKEEAELPKKINISRLLFLIGLNMAMITFIGFVINTLIKRRRRGMIE